VLCAHRAPRVDRLKHAARERAPRLGLEAGQPRLFGVGRDAPLAEGVQLIGTTEGGGALLQAAALLRVNAPLADRARL